MKILVAHASKHGSTKEIAERIGLQLTGLGHEVHVLPVEAVGDIGSYDAAVIGVAIYYGGWYKQGTAFVRSHAEAFGARPVWLFSSGPLGDSPAQDPKELPELSERIRMRGHRVFAGLLVRDTLSMGERVVVKGVKAPYGDFRDWQEIDNWAKEIAGSLE